MPSGGKRAGAGRKAGKTGKNAKAVPIAVAEPIKDSQLPPRQRFFVSEYLANGFNATKAARAAGYSKHTADSQGSRLLQNAKVKAAIAARSQKALVKREITAERVLDEIAKLAYFDPRRLYAPGGELIAIGDLDEDVAACVAGVEVKEITREHCVIGHLKKIKFADKGANLERLGRYLKLFTDRVEHTVKITRVLMSEKTTRLKPSLPAKPEFEK